MLGNVRLLNPMALHPTFFAAVTNGDLTGWIFLAGMTLGGLVGVKAFNMWLNRKSVGDAFDI